MCELEHLLFLSHRIPYPPNKGDKIRSWHVLRHLVGRYKIHLGCFYDDPTDAKYLPLLRSLCETACIIPLDPLSAKIKSLRGLLRGEPLTVGYFYSRRLNRWIDDTVRHYQPSKAFVYCSAMATYVRGAKIPLRVVDMIDLDSEKWRQYAETQTLLRRSLYKREHRELFAFERQIVAEFDSAMFVSDSETQRFVTRAPDLATRVHTMGNGVDMEYFSPNAEYPNPFGVGTETAVFTGAMDYWPNVQAVCWFMANVFPKLKKNRPNFEFWIVGRNPTKAVLQLANRNGVKVTGSVDDVRPYVAHASVVVAPLQIGCGVQNKVLEAMAMAKPVVVSPLACEGIRVADGREVLVASEPGQFVDCIDHILSSTSHEMGMRARLRIEHDFRWDFSIVDRLLGRPIRTQPRAA